MARKRRYLTGPPCPTGGEEHGGMLDIPGTTSWYCPHASHTGVAYPDDDGAIIQGLSRNIFTDKEATEAQEAYWNGSH